MSTQKTYFAKQLYTGEKLLASHAVIVDNGIIAEIVPAASLSPDIDQITPVEILAPAFIDLQVYGAGGKLFGAFPEVDSLKRLAEHNKRSGTSGCLVTIATNSTDVFKKGIDAIREYWSQKGEGILGLHIEGPWINPEKKGAHIGSLIRKPILKEIQELLDCGKGVIKMITLAPEYCNSELIAVFQSHHIIISAGHSNASYAEAMKIFDGGVEAVTHLFNAMSPFHHREPGLAGAAMDHSRVMASIIPDGHHVDYAAIRVAKAVMKERLFAITDAVTETNTGHYHHQPMGNKFESGGVLSGSMLTMLDALRNLVQQVRIELGEALRMCSTYPARLMKQDNEAGYIKIGKPANLVALDHELRSASLI
ncbi:MAG TPA: N-acetylglucosamine-6-phosphate deacetylase [Chitinophagaceae bacterium]|nr:N-acetylglucosamine-6-phosphate deacetylase [Chitinophagaceae bacterium]